MTLRTDKDFKIYLRSNFPFALICNQNADYTTCYETAENCFTENDLFAFNNREYIIRSFACLIKSVQNSKAISQRLISINTGSAYKEWHKSLDNFEKVIELFFRDGITEIVFKSGKKNISLKGEILRSVADIFINYYNGKEYQEDLKYEIKKSDENVSPLTRQYIEQRETKTHKKAISNLKHSIVYYTYQYLKSATQEQKKPFYQRIIGKLLNEVDLLNYNNSRDHRTIQTLIERSIQKLT